MAAGNIEMDYFVAMFNCHKNGGRRKSAKKFKEIWGEQKFKKKIQPFIRKGIMSIFDTKPNKYTKFFVLYNRDIVNGKRK
jgi:hypothetical protein